MKVVMINDCAFVGKTLIKYLPSYIDTVHLKRRRKFFDKTVKIAWRILRADADVFHVHYLLQDCYLALKFRKHPLIGHAHGSDLRSSLKHSVWGRIVRYNLKHCDKVLVSTPDVLDVAREYRDDVEYIPNPVDVEIFYPKPIELHDGKLRVLIASDCDWKVKGTDMAIRALSELRDEVEVFVICYGKDFKKTLALARSLGLHLNVLPRVSHLHMREYYWGADLVIDRFCLGSLGMVSLEAIACGRPVITYVSSGYGDYDDFPLKDVNTVDKVVDAVKKNTPGLWKAEHNYLTACHAPEEIARRIQDIYVRLSSI